MCSLLFLLTILRSETLNPEQRKVFDLAVNGHNVYIGGSGGTGKTFIVKKLMSWCNEKCCFILYNRHGM